MSCQVLNSLRLALICLTRFVTHEEVVLWKELGKQWDTGRPPMYKPFRPFRRGPTTLLRGLTKKILTTLLNRMVLLSGLDLDSLCFFSLARPARGPMTFGIT